MRLCCYRVSGAGGVETRIGVVRGEHVFDVRGCHEEMMCREYGESYRSRAWCEAPVDMSVFLDGFEESVGVAGDAVSWAERVGVEVGETNMFGVAMLRSLGDLDLVSPVPRPNSLRDFMVFEEHVRNTSGEPGDVWFDIPIYYKGNPDSVVGPGDVVEWPRYSDVMDYELEIAAVIGREGRDIDSGDALDYIAGFTVFNDFSARDMQIREMQAMLGPAKGKDFANALGPFLVTVDEFDVEGAGMRAAVDGDVVAEGVVGEMHHSWGDIVEHVSMDEAVYPGDVLGSGTVGGGCGLENGQYLSDGDVVSLEVEGLGVLENRVVS